MLRDRYDSIVFILLVVALQCRDITFRGLRTGTQRHSSSHHFNTIQVNYCTARGEYPQGLLAGGLMVADNGRSS